MIKKFQTEAKKSTQETDNVQSSDGTKCYMCKIKIRKELSTLCSVCLQLNESVRKEKSDLCGKFAIVTGGRIKIGFERSLRLLRDGCFVIVTTR
jgi:hypothetical protein